MEIGLSLGSNLGDRLGNLKQARNLISVIAGVGKIESSRIYETGPVDVPAEYAGILFLNAVLLVESNAGVESLHRELLGVERRMGREGGGARNTPRVIDIDVVFAGDAVLKTASLEVPHPRWSQRRFVVEPLAELRPGLRVPGGFSTVGEVLLALPVNPKVVLFSSQW